MIELEITKDLLINNLKVFNCELDTDLVINFENNNFIVTYNNLEVLKGKVSDYGLTFENQKKFIIDVGNKKFLFLKEVDESDEMRGCNGVMLDKEILKNTGKINSDEDLKDFINDLNKKINGKINLNKTRIVIVIKEKGVYLYVCPVIYEHVLSIEYVDKIKINKNCGDINEVRIFKKEQDLHVYSGEGDEKEIKKVVEYIKGLIYG